MSQLIEDLKVLFTRDLNRLKNEIVQYHSDDALWSTQKSINNSGGNLCLHLIGNLKAFIGNGLGENGYVSDRLNEFGAKHVSRQQLELEIDETIRAVHIGLNSVTEDKLTENFPIVIWDKPTGMSYTLIHLHCHLNYHLGQINYHRRLIDHNEAANG